jgi:hypothetical protein
MSMFQQLDVLKMDVGPVAAEASAEADCSSESEPRH